MGGLDQARLSGTSGSCAGSLTRAASRSARNVAANLAIIVAGFLTAFTHSLWPDPVVGLGIVTLNAGAARESWRVARKEHRAAVSSCPAAERILRLATCRKGSRSICRDRHKPRCGWVGPRPSLN